MSPAPAPAIPSKSLIVDAPAEKTHSAELVVTPTVAAPEIAAPGTDSAEHRPFVLILLVFIVIVTAFAGGVWWKMKTAQLSSAMIHTETMPVKPADSSAKETAAAAPATATPAATENPSPDEASDAGQPESAPATPQELSKFPKVTGIRHWSSADSSTIVLDLEDQVQYEAHRLSGPDRIYFDLRDTQLAPDLLGKSIEIGDTFVSRVRMAQPVAGMTRIVLETRANSTFSVSLEPNPYRLVVEVRKVGATPKGAVNLFPKPARRKRTSSRSSFRLRPKKTCSCARACPRCASSSTPDTADGTSAPSAVAACSKKIWCSKSRSVWASCSKAAWGWKSSTRVRTTTTFRSTSAPASPIRRRRTCSSRCTPTTATCPRRAAWKPTTRISFQRPDRKMLIRTLTAAKPAVTATLSPADLHERIEQSRRLAASVQRSLYGTLSAQNPGLRDRGIKEAGFVVLTESAMPGILAEVSFVSSPTDEQKLRSDGYREQIAEALYRGIARYAASSHGVKVASAAK